MIEKVQDKRIEKILDYWFGELEDGFPQQDRRKLWFGNNSATDEEIRQQFAELVELAGNGRLDEWKQSAKGRLALIILLDQFTRNIYRGSKEAFQFDAHVLYVAREGLASGHDKSLSWVERTFYYLPFEHAENLDDQNQGVALFTELRDSAPERHRERLQGSLDYSIGHRDIIEQFGRFPHRNRVLERESTPAELDYLQDAKTFGQ